MKQSIMQTEKKCFITGYEASEEWKDIPGYEGIYQVSNMGNVRSLDRKKIQMSRYGTPMEKLYRGELMTPTGNGTGYLIIGLAKDGKRKNYYVHRLVADAFIPNPELYEQVNHKDFDKQNNAAVNLEWISQVENIRYSRANMEKPKASAKQTSTGERYITKKGDRWRLNIQRKSLKVDRRFRTIEEAIAARVVMIGG